MLDARMVGDAAVMLGAGRRVKADQVDPRVGIELVAKMGDEIQAGEPLLWIHHDERGFEEASAKLLAAYSIQEEKSAAPALVYETVYGTR